MTGATPLTESTDAAEPVGDRRRLALWMCALIGLGAFVGGLLPWLVTGMRLPLQNLWATAPGPDGMPVALLPFSQYSLMHLFALLVVGATAAGIAARALRHRLPRGGFAMIAGVVLFAQVVAIVQSALVVHAGLQVRSESTLYLGALVAVCVLSWLVGLAAMLLIGLAPRGGALIGLTFGAIAVESWLGAFLQPFWLMGQDWLPSVTPLLQWVAPVLVGAAIAWTGLGTVGRVIAAVMSLIVVWVAPAAITGVSAAAGMRVLAHDPRGMVEYAVNVFQMALFTPELALRPIVAAVVVAAIGLVARWAVARTRRAPDSAVAAGQPPSA